MKAYLSGPITGYDLSQRKTYFKEISQKAANILNCEIVNPMEVIPGCEYMCDPGQLADQPPYIHTWRCWMKYDIIAMMDCDTIVLLPNWYASKGAVTEYRLAKTLGFEVFFVDHLGNISNA